MLGLHTNIQPVLSMGNSFKSRLVTFDETAEKGKLFIVSVELDDHFF